jgi:hypothetical protein
MVTTTDNLRVENPCPFVPTRMNKDGENFFCKSCSKTIVDFRSKTVDEIKCSINKDTCGIFTIDQLPGQQQMKFSRQLLFYCFSVLSILGFSVGPLSAQTTQTKKDTVLIDTKSNNQDTVKVDKINTKKADTKAEKKGLFHRKKKHKVIGCPAF